MDKGCMIHIYNIIIKMKKSFFWKKIIGIRDYDKGSKLDWEKPHIFSYMWNLRGKDMKIEGEL